MNRRFRIGQWLLVLAIAATPGFQVSVDWYFLGSYHVFNDKWPAHAKYHLIVYHLTLILFSAAAIYGCLGPWRSLPLTSWFALFSVLAFWIPYFVAALFPFASPIASESEAFPDQLIVGAILAVIAILGFALTRQPQRGLGTTI